MLLNYKSRELYTWCTIAQSGPLTCHRPDSKVHGANMGPTWVLSAPDGPHVGPMNPANAMVTYSLRRVSGGRTATLAPQTVRRPYGFYANRTATSRFLARRKVIASLAVFLTWH